MKNQYRFNSQFYIPRRKDELIDLIAPSWKGFKYELKAMERKQLVAILYRIRQDGITAIMRKPLDLNNLTAQVSDKTNKGDTHGT